MEYNLPRGYLSYSQFDLWTRSPKSYRKRYYENETPFESAQTRFGNFIGEQVESGSHKEDKFLSKLLDYSHKEYPIDISVDGLELKGYLDQFNLEGFKICEMKTGHRNPKGKLPWDDKKVMKSKQLPFYSVLVELKHGTVSNEVILQFLETQFKERVIMFDGHELKGQSKTLEIISEPVTFKRRITQVERKMFLKQIIKVAKEISDDYTNWQKTNK